MQDLRVIGVESGALLVASDHGERYRLPVDEVLQSKMRQAGHPSGSSRKLAPREIQAHIRGGMSAEDVADVTGASLEHIRRFEGPVLAEREYIIRTALNVPVHTAVDTDPATEGTTFGSAIRERLSDLSAQGERWSSWKEDGQGWIVKLSFTVNNIDRDARWQFDPKKLALAPINHEATALSQQGEVAGAMVPRLRAVPHDERVPDQSRFDSGAFIVPDAESEGPFRLEPIPFTAGARAAGDDATQTTGQTADLLEALRRRRGEREQVSIEEMARDEPAQAAFRLIEVPLDEIPLEPAGDVRTQPQVLGSPAPAAPHQASSSQHGSQSHGQHAGAAQGQPAKPARRGRAAMPSWDEIVFGARSDDDPA